MSVYADISVFHCGKFVAFVHIYSYEYDTVELGGDRR